MKVNDYFDEALRRIEKARAELKCVQTKKTHPYVSKKDSLGPAEKRLNDFLDNYESNIRRAI